MYLFSKNNCITRKIFDERLCQFLTTIKTVQLNVYQPIANNHLLANANNVMSKPHLWRLQFSNVFQRFFHIYDVGKFANTICVLCKCHITHVF